MTSAVLYIGVLFALTLLLAGHNEPGGGFIAGAMAASIFAILYLVHGREYVETRFRTDYRSIATGGIMIILLVAVLPVVVGRPILTSLVHVIHVGLYLDLPLFGRVPVVDEIHLSSAVGFDVGVFLVVLGSILMILRRAAGGETPG